MEREAVAAEVPVIVEATGPVGNCAMIGIDTTGNLEANLVIVMGGSESVVETEVDMRY